MGANFIQWLMSQSWSWWIQFFKDWGSAVKDFGTPLTGFFTACVALSGLWGWKRQMRGNLEQEISRKVLTESTNLKRYIKNAASILAQGLTVSKILVSAQHSKELEQITLKATILGESKTGANLEKLKNHLVLFEQVVVEGIALWGNDFEILVKDLIEYSEGFITVIDNANNHISLMRIISEHYGDRSELYGGIVTSALQGPAPEGNLEVKVKAIHDYVGKKLARRNLKE